MTTPGEQSSPALVVRCAVCGKSAAALRLPPSAPVAVRMLMKEKTLAAYKLVVTCASCEGLITPNENVTP